MKILIRPGRDPLNGAGREKISNVIFDLTLRGFIYLPRATFFTIPHQAATAILTHEFLIPRDSTTTNDSRHKK